MSDREPEAEEYPEPSPQSALLAAALSAHVQMLSEQRGRKAALRFLRLVEDNLIDVESLEKVVLIRGEEMRATAKRNRRAGLNWLRGLMPVFLRKLEG